MLTFSPHHVISVKVGFLLNKTAYDMKFIINLTQNDSQKRQKRQKRHILALCFLLGALLNLVGKPRASSQKSSHDYILPMIYLRFSYVQMAFLRNCYVFKIFSMLFTTVWESYTQTKLRYP